MKAAYFDCFAGISGDMAIGALIDAGLDYDLLVKEISKLGLTGYDLSCEKTERNGIAGTKFSVRVLDEQPHRSFKDIRGIIERSGLEPEVKSRAVSVFMRLAKAEGKIHGVDPDSVHFHEVGAVDSIIDIAGTAIGLRMLGIERVSCSKINLGSGFAESMHGTIPVPAPATLELLKGIPVFDSGTGHEMTTPTGAAIIAEISGSFGLMHDIKIDSVGYGAGSRKLVIPNMLRLIIGKETSTSHYEQVSVLETNIDDMNPQIYEYVLDRLFASGALDAFIVPVIMKKSRPGSLLKVIVSIGDEEKLAKIVSKETTTAGIRIQRLSRIRYSRRMETVDTPYGSIKVKVIGDGETVLSATPEYEDCKAAALKHSKPVKEVIESALISFKCRK